MTEIVSFADQLTHLLWIILKSVVLCFFIGLVISFLRDLIKGQL